MPAERLQKILARRGVASRRHAEELIREGRVRVDGAVATLGQRADPETSEIRVDGAPLPAATTRRTLMLHKPRGVLVTTADERGRRTVFDLLDDPPPNLRHVGRLDRDSEGLLLLTSDGELAHRLAHPRYRVNKTYEALVEGEPSVQTLGWLREGIDLEDGRSAPAEVDLLRREGARSWLRLVLHEGRKRQVRRMLDAVGHPLRRLIRTELGGLALGSLAAGQSRPLLADEERRLAALVGLVDAAESRSLSSARTTGRWEPEARPISSEAIARSVAIDGPTAAGKSVVGRALADRLGLGFLDTGMMYRACTFSILDAGVDPEDAASVVEHVRALALDVEWPRPATPRVLIGGRDVTEQLREPEIEATVSLISRVSELRDEMVRRQRAIATRSPVVMAGRDIGTRVLTDARAKIFLAASLEVRARRRLAEERDGGRASTLDRVTVETVRRDELDATGKRAIRPEQAAPDALVIDTDGLTVEEVVARAAEAYETANAP